jgi:hypothetical protein
MAHPKRNALVFLAVTFILAISVFPGVVSPLLKCAYAETPGATALKGEAAGSVSAMPSLPVSDAKERTETGNPVGTISWVSGTAYVQPTGQSFLYRADKAMPLYHGDKLITDKSAKMAFSLNDGSTMSLAPGTELVINLSVYNPEQKKRVAMIDMLAGKARFVVKKFNDYKYSQFNVSTKSSVVGVRGSDFIVEIVTETGETIQRQITIVTTLENTVIEVWDPANPENRIVLNSYQELVSMLGELGEPDNVTMEEIEQELSDFNQDDDDGDDDGDGNDEGDEEGEGDGDPDDFTFPNDMNSASPS